MRLKRVLRWFGICAGALFVLALIAALVLWWSLHASLAQLDGRGTLPGLRAEVRIERDALGVPTIYARNRLDATRALGFLHAQERFFQMDLSRRAGGGELSELVGVVALERDQQQRVHRPRFTAQQVIEQSSAEERALTQAYADGVNAGLAALGARPPEYLALRAVPEPWKAEDIYLVGYAMFGRLHDTDGYGDYRELILRKALSPAALAFFNSPDIAWSAALDGSEIPAPPLPTAAEFSAGPDHPQARVEGQDGPRLARDETDASSEPGVIGSNNWAVDGQRSGTGSAIVANDMHLGLSVPNTWYRVRMIYEDSKVGAQDIVGVTLPGTPVIVSGSNRYVAWANTASDLDITDLVAVEFDPTNPHRYRTATGWRELDDAREVIHVRGSTNVVVTVEGTMWGPVITRGNTQYALVCTMHEPEAANMGLIDVERSRDVEAALQAANRSGTPVNNFVVGDRAGHIGYSLLGRLPNRVGFDGITPRSWADGTCGWQGWLAPEKYPRVLNPTNGILWTSNNRTLGSPEYNVLHVAPDNGARARQVRDDLLAQTPASEKRLWSIYCDDRGLFLAPWQKLTFTVLETNAAGRAEWLQAARLANEWGGHAATNSQGYRLVRAFRLQVLELLFEPVNQRIARVDPRMRLSSEDAAWAMLKAKPAYMLDPKFASYENLLAEAASRVLEDLRNRHIALEDATWGGRNRLGIRHPLSQAVPTLGRWFGLDMPDVAVSGDSHMPKVHAPGEGVSERMIVSPGHEENGLYNMPCGQSGHFLSPYYRSEMDSWLKIAPQPLLPGKKEHELVLLPAKT